VDFREMNDIESNDLMIFNGISLGFNGILMIFDNVLLIWKLKDRIYDLF
jgi:hypothetical protein